MSAVERPAHAVDDETRLVLGGVDLPQLLDADAEGLGLDTVAQVEALEQRLGERAAAALGEEGLLGPELDTGLVVVGLGTVPADAHVAGRNPRHSSAPVIKHLGGGKAGINLDAELLRLLGEPAAHVAEAHDVVPLVVHLGRRGQPEGPLGGEQEEAVLLRLGHQGSAARAPIG